MSENKTGKYLKYAVGEIFLVVIGILIALQINNWNENRKESKIRNNYYQQILRDLKKDTVYINQEIAFLNSSISLYTEYLKNLTTKESADEIISELAQLKLNWEFTYLNFNTNTIESLISTGDIKLIPDAIRNRLLDLRNTQNTLIETTSGNNAVYLNSSRKALGLGGINLILEFHPNMSDSLIPDKDKVAMINIINTSFQLKNFTEQELSKNLNYTLVYIDELSKLIKEELNK